MEVPPGILRVRGTSPHLHLSSPAKEEDRRASSSQQRKVRWKEDKTLSLKGKRKQDQTASHTEKVGKQPRRQALSPGVSFEDPVKETSAQDQPFRAWTVSPAQLSTPQRPGLTQRAATTSPSPSMAPSFTPQCPALIEGSAARTADREPGPGHTEAQHGAHQRALGWSADWPSSPQSPFAPPSLDLPSSPVGSGRVDAKPFSPAGRFPVASLDPPARPCSLTGAHVARSPAPKQEDRTAPRTAATMSQRRKREDGKDDVASGGRPDPLGISTPSSVVSSPSVVSRRRGSAHSEDQSARATRFSV